MSLSTTLSRYFAVMFSRNAVFVYGGAALLILLVDTVDLMRLAEGKEVSSFGLVAEMALLRLPRYTERILPFVFLFAGMWTFLRLTRSSELVVARAAGVSAWQFLAPAIAIAFVFGLVATLAFNPVAAALSERFERLEARHFEGQSGRTLAFAREGLWLRQRTDKGGSAVIRGDHVTDKGIALAGVTVLLFDKNERFQTRIDAKRAILKDGAWLLSDAFSTDKFGHGQKVSMVAVPTDLTVERIEESFATPETLSVYDLPAFIASMEEAGFAATRHKLYWHSLLAQPLLLVAMVLIAATVSLRLTRRGGLGLLVLAGVIAGFGFYLVTDIAEAMGAAGRLPPSLAAWGPVAATLLLGLSLLFHLEDG
ncbi:MAG: LPS export ABC transporter permease LptG [Alphaproteobacteria bacterium]